MAAAFALTPLTDTAEQLATKLDGWLDNGTATELHGQVLIEHHKLSHTALEQCVRNALARIYGPGWRQHVEGIE